jgi:hypothetical protein
MTLSALSFWMSAREWPGQPFLLTAGRRFIPRLARGFWEWVGRTWADKHELPNEKFGGFFFPKVQGLLWEGR